MAKYWLSLANFEHMAMSFQGLSDAPHSKRQQNGTFGAHSRFYIGLQRSSIMNKLCIAALIALAPVVAFTPQVAFAQQNPENAKGGAATGAATGAVGGAIVGGPVGAVVGGVGGAIVGGIIGDNTPKFKTYVVEQGVPSYRYNETVAVGTVLPNEGVTYYEVPEQYGVQKTYRYTVINGQTVLVEPKTRRIVQIIE